jgi:hypothetical protein
MYLIQLENCSPWLHHQQPCLQHMYTSHFQTCITNSFWRNQIDNLDLNWFISINLLWVYTDNSKPENCIWNFESQMKLELSIVVTAQAATKFTGFRSWYKRSDTTK